MHDNVVSLERQPAGLADRVRRKRDVLKDWLNGGIPPGKAASVPRSLTQARLWSDPSFGIQSIGSPNDFTTTHAEFGADVAEIAQLIRDLKSKTKRTSKPSRSPRSVSSGQQSISTKDVERSLAAMASQWHMARHEVEAQRKRADLAEKRLAIVRAESRVKDDEIAELRRQLSLRPTVVR